LSIQQDTDVLTRTICPVEISKFEVTGSSDLQAYEEQIKHNKINVNKTMLW